MNRQTKVTGVVLAGGLARRMGGQDKGLIHYQDKPLIEHALKTMATVAENVVINANRNLEQYRHYGFPVISDLDDQFQGPLAGILSIMTQTDAEVLLVMPCDAPLFTAASLQRLLDELNDADADIAVAFDGERLQPVFMALKTLLMSSLQEYLTSGQRKIDRWMEKHDLVHVNFTGHPDVFKNINTLDELAELELKEHDRK